MNQNYYPIDFEAQYQQTAQKILQITKKFQAKIINSQPPEEQQLETHLEMIQEQISDKELVFRKQSIYSQFASGQTMAEKRKSPPDLCPECGDQTKKEVQCQFCAEIFCIKCCSRKRIIPFVSKDFRLCCEQCHWKFVKLFDNKHFYQQKQKITNAITFVKNKTTKFIDKLNIKKQHAEKVKTEKRSEKIKQKNLETKILTQEKKYKALQQQYRRVIGQKAQKIKEQQRRKRIQEQERQKAKKAEQERSRIQQLQRKQEERLHALEEKKKRQLEKVVKETDKRVEQKKGITKIEQTSSSDSWKKKQAQLKKRQQELLHRELLLKKKLQQDLQQRKSNRSNLSSKKLITPKQSIDRISQDKGKVHLQINDTISEKRSRKQSEQLNKNDKKSNKSSDYGNLQKLSRVDSTQSAKEQNKKSIDQVRIEQARQQVILDPLEKSLANMLKPKKDDEIKSYKKDDDNKSMYSNMSKNILDMNVNELLAVRIPSNSAQRASLPIHTQEQRPDRFSSQILNPRDQQNLSPLRSSKKVHFEQPIIQQTVQQVRIDRQSIIRKASMITSYKETVHPETQIAPNKCSCQIM